MKEVYVQDAKSKSGRLAKRVLRKLMQIALKKNGKINSIPISCASVSVATMTSP